MTMIGIATKLQSLGLTVPLLLILVKVTLILLLARLCVLAFSRISAATKHLGITIALCSAIILPLLSAGMRPWRVPVFPQTPAKTIGATGDEIDLRKTTVRAAVDVATATGVVPVERVNAAAEALRMIKRSWQGFLLLSVLAVSLLLIGRMVVGICGVWLVAGRAGKITDDDALIELDRASDHLHLRREVRLLRSGSVSVPVVWGVRKPVLLLPAESAEWTAERLRIVLLHELAHVKRWDAVTLLVCRFAVALFWFHPLMWALERIARAECERACDDLVLAGGTKPSDYAEHLLSIARALPRSDPFRSVTLAMTRRSQLEGRLLAILQPHIRRGTFSKSAVTAAAVMALAIVAPIAAVRLVAAPARTQSAQDIKPAVLDQQQPSGSSMIVEAKDDKHKRTHDDGDTPETGREWFSKAYELHRQDRYPEAIAAFQKAVERGYRVPTSMYNIACGYAQLDDAPNAVKWLRSAIAAGFDDADLIAGDSDLDPIRSNPEFRALMEQARGLAKRDRLQKTLDEYGQLRASGSKDGSAWFDAGLTLLSLRRFDESIDAFQKAIALGEKPATSMYNIACVYSRKGDTANGLLWLQKAINEGFDNVGKLDDDSDLDNLRKSPRFDDLRKMAEDLSLNAGWHGNWSRKIISFLDGTNDWKTDLSRYRAQTAKYPTMGRAWFNLGYAALQAGEEEESIRAFTKALDLGYRVPTTTYNIACAHARAGHNEVAIDWLERAHKTGFKLRHYLENDDDLDGLRGNARFRALRTQVRGEEGE